MSVRRHKIREQVMATIVAVIADATAEGRDGIAAARAAFPTVPEGILYEALATYDFREEEAWWQTVEKTIEGEIINKAIGASTAGGKG